MNATVKPVTVWAEEPRCTGPAWFLRNSARLVRAIKISVLARFISFLGSLGAPGARAIGVVQAWALRRMGVRCESSEVWIGPNVRFDFPRHIRLGRRVVIGADARLTARDPVSIGDDFLSAPGLYLNTGTHDPATLVPQSSPITIGPGVWCGLRVTICSGVTIGAGAIIGAGSLVLQDLPAGQLAFGVPCRPRRDITPLRHGQKLWSNFRPNQEDPS